jgi:ABC-2 type transport system permease protein
MYSMMRNPEMLQRFNLNEMVIRPLLHNMSVLLIFIVPAITMRMFPEEKRAGTYELLLTSPVRIGEIVAGKFLGGLALVTIMVALSGVFGLLLFPTAIWPELPMMLWGTWVSSSWRPAFLAIGTLLSSPSPTTSSWPTSAAVRAARALHDRLARRGHRGRGRPIVRYVSITDHFQQLTQASSTN